MRNDLGAWGNHEVAGLHQNQRVSLYPMGRFFVAFIDSSAVQLDFASAQELPLSPVLLGFLFALAWNVRGIPVYAERGA